MVKNLPAVQETQVRSLGWEDSLEKEMATHSLFLPGKFHEQRSLAGYSPQGHKELDMTEQLTHIENYLPRASVSFSRGHTYCPRFLFVMKSS